MSQTTQFVSIPLGTSRTTVKLASSVWGVGGAKIEGGKIHFTAGPDHIGYRYVPCEVRVQPAEETKPKGFQSAGKVSIGDKEYEVFVKVPD